jgi:hypothetical protein
MSAELLALRIEIAENEFENAKLKLRLLKREQELGDLSFAAPPTKSNVWSVHDCHSHCSGQGKGIWARAALDNGIYGACIGASRGKDYKEKNNKKIMGPLGEVEVSKGRYNQGVTKIRVGDTLYMGDTHTNKVWKGTVIAQPVAGPFCPLSSKENSFFLKVPHVTPPTEAYTRGEVEVSFKVTWSYVGPLTEEWKKYLGTHHRVTISQLKTAPPA